ncbi:MAG: hypothetical protein ACTHJ6_09530 [Oryzihumus sp.]
MPTFTSLEAAARAYGAEHGVEGRKGGWIYRRGQAVCQGWRAYGRLLVESGQITALDADGKRTTLSTRARGQIHWSKPLAGPAKTFVTPDPLPPALAVPNGLLAVPEAVVVDTRGGYVFRNASDGLAFTVAGAKAFRDQRNAGLRVGTYKVYRLTEVED